METDIKKKLTKDGVEKELQLKEDQIEQRLLALQEEVATVGPTIRKALLNHPLVSVGGALLAGLVVGLIFGGKKRRNDGFGAAAGHRALVDHYVDAVVEEARHRVAKGQDVDEAVHAALKDRVPLIVYEVPVADEKRGLLGSLVSLVLGKVVPLGIQMGLDYLAGEGKQDAESDA